MNQRIIRMVCAWLEEIPQSSSSSKAGHHVAERLLQKVREIHEKEDLETWLTQSIEEYGGPGA